MTIALAYAILALIWLVLGVTGPEPGQASPKWRGMAGSWIPFAMLVLIGWQVFGPLLHK